MNFDLDLIDDSSFPNVCTSNRDNVLLDSSFCNDKIFIVHQNIRSMRENFSSLVAHIDSFACVPDVVFLSEIWIYGFEENDYSIPGFNFFSKTNENYAAGGVGCFVKDNHVIIEVVCVNLISADVLKVSVEIDHVTYVFLCVYRLHTFSVANFINEFSDVLASVKSKNLIIVGDFNINILDGNDSISNYQALLASHGLSCFIYEPTRPSSGSCLDHIYGRLCNVELTECVKCVFDFKITDHCMTGLVFAISKTRLCKSPMSVARKAKIDFAKLKNSLYFEFWEDVFAASDSSTAYSIFIDSLKKHILASSSFQSPKKIVKRLKPWISRSIVNKVTTKNKLRLKCKKNPGNRFLKERYKKLCAELKKDIPICRDTYYRAQFSSAQGNLKNEWRVVNSLLNKASASKKPTVLHVDNSVICNKLDIADAFNCYFTNVGCNLLPSHVQSMCCSCPSRCKRTEHVQSRSFVFQPISSFEILKAIGYLPNSSSCGADGISSYVLKKIAYLLVDVLAYVFNRCVFEGVFPEELKCADVIPLFKKGSVTEISNYRPISLLSVFSKIFEKLMKNRIMSFLDKTKFFNPAQFGFLKGKSTEDALLQFCSLTMSQLDEKKCVAGLFVDITKAFDMVSHSLLLSKLEKAGFRGFMLHWFRSYLENRSQRVKIDDTRSDIRFFNLGVPQGSVLGPILFLVYINSLFALSFKGAPTAFADDVGFSYGASSPLDLISNINWDLDLLRLWFSEHSLVISSKTKIMFYSLSSSSTLDANVYFHAPECRRYKLLTCHCSSGFSSPSFLSDLTCSDKCFPIEIVNEFKYLGLTLDARMSFTNHAESLKKYFRCTLRHFYYLRNVCSTELLKTIYYGIFHSRLQYGIACWGGVYRNKIHPLLILQKYVVRKICRKSGRHPSFPLFCALKILPVRHLYCFKVLKIFFMMSGNLNFRLISSYNLRGNLSNLFPVPLFRTTAYRNFFAIMSYRLFNILPQSIRTITSSGMFLKSVKMWLLSSDFDALESRIFDVLV